MAGCTPAKLGDKKMSTPQTSPKLNPEGLGKLNSLATMEDYWLGKARWQLDRVWTQANTGWEYGFLAGSRLIIVKGTWYLFHRKIYWNDKCSGMNLGKLGTVAA